jgi:hypothetical protein
MNLKDLDKNDVLRALGIESRNTSYILPAIGLFGAALIIGAGIGLLLAPKSGRELRNDVGERMSGMKARVRRQVDEVREATGPGTTPTPY